MCRECIVNETQSSCFSFRNSLILIFTFDVLVIKKLWFIVNRTSWKRTAMNYRSKYFTEKKIIWKSTGQSETFCQSPVLALYVKCVYGMCTFSLILCYIKMCNLNFRFSRFFRLSSLFWVRYVIVAWQVTHFNYEFTLNFIWGNYIQLRYIRIDNDAVD